MENPNAESRRNVLVLHGGGGPGTVASLAGHLRERANVLAPTLPGWNGTPRPAEITNVAALAAHYLRFLEAEGVKDAVVVGSSLGGWLGAELALQDTAGRIAGLVMINAAGVDIPGHPIRNITGLTPPELAKIAFHDPSKFGAGAPPPTPESIAVMRGNQATLMTLAGEPYMHDPSLLARLSGVRLPTLVIWGESDGVVTANYGRAYAAAIPNARFELVREAGHLPHLEQPAETFRLVDAFLAAS
jgi:pimeloyl-ACP methyl ester carboxylesterase